MNASEKALVSYLAGIKEKKIGFMEFRTDVDGWCADISLDARYDLFRSECIFDDCSDKEAALLLDSFLKNDLSVGWSVSEQLCKLLSKRGQLVGKTMDRLLKTLDWYACSQHQLFLSYLAVKEDGASFAVRLLDQVPEDGRDGLFLACYILQSEELDRKLKEKFMKWGEGKWSPTSTGELRALENFIAKWLKRYSYADLEGVIRLYFKYRVEG